MTYTSRSTAPWMFALAASLGLGGVVWGVASGTEALAEVWIAAGIVAVALVLANFGVLSVRVDRDEVRWWFGAGPIGRRVPLERVRGAEARRSPWYWGWGIRWTPGGWLWRAHGLDAVWLELDGGRRVGIGTQDPEGLLRAVQARLEERAG